MIIKALNILVIDDQESMRKVIVHILKELGHQEITQTPDSKFALQLVQKGTFDLVISDWHMPELTGLELLQEVRKTDNIKTLPFILVTGDNEKSHVEEAIKAGVSSFIVKPFSPSEIEKKIKLLFPEPQKEDAG